MHRLLIIIAALLLAPASGSAAPVPSRCVGDCWKPTVDTSMFLQLGGTVRIRAATDAYEVDGVDTPSSTIRALHRRGIKAICYISGGSWERYRDDADEYPEHVLGKVLDGWPDERWVDIRALHVLGPILTARIQACARRGFDAVDFDNVDGYANESGFPLTAADQLRFNRWLANTAHRAGLAAVLKNDGAQAKQLVRWFDAVLVEQCFQYDECELYSPFVRAGKPVWVAEYVLPLRRFCAPADRLRFHAARYPLALNGPWKPCP